MKQLLKLTEDFSVSRPVFKLTRTDDSSRISANAHAPVFQYTPTPEEGNVLSELVCEHYREHFRNGEFKIDRNQIAISAMREIRDSMRKFLEKNLEMKSPRQSKIYRWYYRNLPDHTEFNDTLVMVYKYMRSFCGEDMRSSNLEHTKNAIALLDAIMEKHDER